MDSKISKEDNKLVVSEMDFKGDKEKVYTAARDGLLKYLADTELTSEKRETSLVC